jgi:hypothetical protein
MPDDATTSAEQDAPEVIEDALNEEELNDDELDALFSGEEATPAEGDTPEEDKEDDEDAEEEEEPAEDTPAEDKEDDEDPLAEIKKQAEALKTEEEKAQEAAKAQAEEAERRNAMKADLLKELFGGEKKPDKINIGDKEIDLENFRNEVGEDLANQIDEIVTARSFQMAEAMVQKQMEAAQFASQEQVKELIAQNEEFKFLSQVATTHPEIWQLQNDDAFWGWVDKQGDDVATLIDRGGVAGTNTVVSAYKKAMIQSKNKEIDTKLGAKLDKHKKLHGSTMKSKASASKAATKQGDAISEDEADTLFNEISVDDD